ncbi:MAG: DNA-processing protein DprA [Anaerolineales bacterium]|jgi:DNA processing protein
MADNSIKYWVGFNLVKGIGPVRLRGLVDFFGDVESSWNASLSDLERSGLGLKEINALQEIRSSDLLERTWDYIQSKNITVLTWEDEKYPRLLREIDHPPPVLYLRGEIRVEDDPSVSVVGTRRMTEYGKQVTTELSQTLAHNGITIVSGLARGVDAVAHRVALESNGRTIAVFGCGIDRVYPPEHRSLAEEIAGHGALVSDYPPGTKPEASNFPARNRIISGLSRVVVVIEAGSRSGALITANFAAEQGRDVFAVPGFIYSPASTGTNNLIQQGAFPMLGPQDVLEILNLDMIDQHRSARQELPADATEAELLRLLGREPLHVDEISSKINMPIENVTASLAVMELKGMIRQVGSMHYVAVREAAAKYEP